jgi:hypothetical protein
MLAAVHRATFAVWRLSAGGHCRFKVPGQVSGAVHVPEVIRGAEIDLAISVASIALNGSNRDT